MEEKKGFSTEYYRFSERIKTIGEILTRKISGGKKGFYDSQGEYHAYIPEFGEDVNNWMENNW